MIDEHLYHQIVQVMPISCIDLVAMNENGQVLLAKRTNEPANGKWWFPGGRVYYLETRLDAAVRKLREECGLESEQLVELGTFDVIVERSDKGGKVHGITTLFYAKVSPHQTLRLDSQSSEAQWRFPIEWLSMELHPFVQQGLATLSKHRKLLKVSM